MTTATATKSRTRKPATKQRSATLCTLNNGAIVLSLTVGDAETRYLLKPLAADFGAAFHLTKAIGPGGVGGEKYDVLLHGKESSCTCKGNTYCGHCKHVEALTALVQSGKLAVKEPQPRGCELEDL